MCPVEVLIGDRKLVTLGPGKETLLLNEYGRTIAYDGDRSGDVLIEGGNGKIAFNLKPGEIKGTEIEVHVAPIEFGEPTTPVKLPLNLKRV